MEKQEDETLYTFPSNDSHTYENTGGLTLRDYFAAKAMNAFISGQDLPANFKHVSEASYEAADAMLKERLK